jgi:ribosomal 30S subunit maturation factor RimM
VYASDGGFIGTVADVIEAGGSDILKVDSAGQEILIPFAHEYIKAIDSDRRRIEVELPEELRDLNK